MRMPSPVGTVLNGLSRTQSLGDALLSPFVSGVARRRMSLIIRCLLPRVHSPIRFRVMILLSVHVQPTVPL